MYPSVAVPPQFQPHHHMDQRLNYDPLARPYDLNGATVQANKTAFNSIPRFPQPVQRSDSHDLRSNDPNKVANVGEHALRRKTPNGTLAAGYDGTPGDRTIQPPAAKHLLVSSLEPGQVLPSQSTLPVENWQPVTLDQTASAQYPNFPPVYNKQDPNRTNNGLANDQVQGGGGAGPSWVRSLNVQPGMDSVLHQTVPMQPSQRYYLQNGPSIPTVMPATLQQPCLGPTAPVGTGPYGPYWPDGAYIPYRPAALRDTRFLPNNQFANNPNTPQIYDPNQPPYGPTSLPASGLSTPGLSWNQGPPPPMNHEPFLQPPQQQNFPPRYPHQNTLPYHVRNANVLNSNVSTHPQGEAVGWPGSHPSRNIPPSDISSRAQNAEFKEKVLSWAHGVYVDLLATLNARRQSLSKPGVDGQPQRPPKPSIYPKPPRQPGLDFSSSSDIQRHNGYPAARYDLYTQNPGLAQRPASGAALPRVAGPYQNENSTMATAASALEMLTNLCMESGWEWIDGMLLGGCLAYGLGDYDKAMRWYSRIIERDDKHVEAISNLAATLLALERREEAMHYWSRAVKLRPSYFEAVEHLIGLLCSSHRSREAVNIIEHVEKSLRVSRNGDCFRSDEHSSEAESDVESTASYERAAFDYDKDLENPVALNFNVNDSNAPGFASSGYAIPGSDNGRMLALVHAKGNMLYSLGDNAGAAAAFEDAILIAAGRRRHGIKSLITQIINAFISNSRSGYPVVPEPNDPNEPVLLYPEKALQTASLVFPPYGNLPGLQYVPEGLARKAAISTTSNSLLSLAKIYQDGMSQSSATGMIKSASPGVRDILALYYLSLSLQPSPSTANNVGILLAGIQNNVPVKVPPRQPGKGIQVPEIPGVVPGSGVSLALAYYYYGLNLDNRHAHLYTNLGSLLKDIGQLQPAIRMYEQAVQCDGNFDIALANLANAVKDAGRINDAIGYYRRAVRVNPDFAEAVCGLANALNSVCNWAGRGGIVNGYGFQDRWHVDDQGMLRDAAGMETGSGWMQRVVDIVDRQLREGETWGRGLLSTATIEQLCAQLTSVTASGRLLPIKNGTLAALLQSWAGQKWEGARVVKLIERAIRAITWQWYQDRHVYGKEYPLSKYRRPQLPAALTVPNAPTVLPFHTFTCPLSAKQVRHISQRNGLRISCSTLRSPWLPSTVYPPPSPPNPYLRVGYVSSDFNNHPLAHLMQSVFGLHNPNRVKAYCYATTPSDNSVHRQQIEREAPVFYDASSWSVDRLVQQIVKDGIHILVNLNGYTRGARNEVFAARPAPIHMSFMGFAGTLGAEWSDYILADELSIPRDTLSPGRRDYRIEDRIFEEEHAEEAENWVYAERIVFTRDTFFCCDHKQSAPDSDNPHITWEEELERRWKRRKELFPNLSDDAIIFGNFNQLYKIEPTTFRTWLRILSRVPNAVLWLLRFPDVGEQNLRQTALAWAGQETASRIIFTDVAPKQQHIARAQICDLFLDTPECNAHTTAADTLWSGTPILTYPRYKYKMCSRMASSILTSALPSTEAGRQARNELVATSDEDYENKAVRLGLSMRYEPGGQGRATGRLVELRKMLFTNRWQSKLFDTRRWVNDLEEAYEKVWNAWVRGEENDIWL
ncbi:hypothetical protein VTN96DRAFT_1154 [Rasamsonia emersonii]|uniref:protein O-GlcNAc transferase n=1 Tax=Rasamsonia emersonii (strain ATCC 16479 / CBS 393.64 / IMI 116815) TaxID=1408163 RepID=A0A0F4YZ41_RASE3|nr:hypothetical protein T310_3105 [Rasamsonia emersonii CBS 393.64]KKA22888.1 hypothetical protein T310_3105 [Rasamsonia emersonii CBS 393.64]